jgi:hypothetical protein
MHTTGHPLVYEVNTRVLLRELGKKNGGILPLDKIPDEILDGWASQGINAVWMMGAWTGSVIGREIAQQHPDLQEEYRRALPDVTPEDIGGSPYAVMAYVVPPELGGARALAGLRKKLARRGMGLILDFVANHTACDHAWITAHPEYYVQGEPGDETTSPGAFFRAATETGDKVIAHGKDPMYSAWTDTAQMNLAEPALREALINQLLDIAEWCDGVRCDMAMLVLNDVFARTWAGHFHRQPEGEFWRMAVEKVRSTSPQFLFIGEVYWDREWDLQQMGFDFTYDKRLYDRLRYEGAMAVHDHLGAELDFQRHCVRFIENHDEARAARAFSSEPWHFAAAMIMASVPGMVLMHEGQQEGWTLRLPVQLIRRMPEPGSPSIQAFYQRLLSCINSPVVREGKWTLLPMRPGWHDNSTWQNFVVHWWHHETDGDRMVVVNYAPHTGQCYVDVPLQEMKSVAFEFKDLMSDAAFVRDRAGLLSKGMYFDLPGYGFHFFEVTSVQR